MKRDPEDEGQLSVRRKLRRLALHERLNEENRRPGKTRRDPDRPSGGFDEVTEQWNIDDNVGRSK